MPRKSRLNLPPLKLGKESTSKRIARLRKQLGYTQTELAEFMGLTQPLISAYETDRLKLKPDMIIRFAKTFKITTDELLGVKPSGKSKSDSLSLKLIRRMKRIESLPASEQTALLKTIDNFLKGADK